LFVSYPKFTTEYGTQVSFKLGVWNGSSYEKRLKVINMPVLKSHQLYGVTAACKNYMGVPSEGQFSGRSGLSNAHACVATGGMGELMAETTFPTLNILCAVWVNAIPIDGPITPYSHATRTNVLSASTDPVALDYWASKNILVEASQAIGYTDTHTLDPDSSDKTGVGAEAIGVWLPKTRDALTSAGYQVTMNPQQINVYVVDATPTPTPTPTPSPSPTSTPTPAPTPTGAPTSTPTVTPTPTAEPTPAPTSSSSPSPSPCSSPTPLPSMVFPPEAFFAAAVIGVAAIIAITLFAFRRQKKK
jgi:hypothetical protein